jgi:hypothetical protein
VALGDRRGPGYLFDRRPSWRGESKPRAAQRLDSGQSAECRDAGLERVLVEVVPPHIAASDSTFRKSGIPYPFAREGGGGMGDEESTVLKEEVEALGEVLERLTPLSGPSRERVIEYVIGALDISIGAKRPDAAPRPVSLSPSVEPPSTAVPPSQSVHDIRTLRDSKQPGSALEMAALVGYYLADLAPEDDRKTSVDALDLERLFKQAGFPLPARIGNVLPNAAGAGYFDGVERGKYRLNPVGYNLVTHGLPPGQSARVPVKRTSRKAAAKKRTPAKKTARRSSAKRSR